MRPVTPAAAIRIGSGTFKRQSRPNAASPIRAVGRSKMARRPRTTQAPAMAPAAAAVTPLTNAFTCGFSPKRSNQR